MALHNHNSSKLLTENLEDEWCLVFLQKLADFL